MAVYDYPPGFSLFRIVIGGDWEARPLGALLEDVSDLYEIRVALDIAPERLEYWYASRSRSHGRFWWSRERPPFWRDAPFPRLGLVRIEYGSPGFVDLVGIGKVMEQVRLFLEKLIDLKAEQRREDSENRLLEEEIQSKKIENARNFVRLVDEARAVGLSSEDARYLVYEVDAIQERVAELVDRGNIKSIEAAPDA